MKGYDKCPGCGRFPDLNKDEFLAIKQCQDCTCLKIGCADNNNGDGCYSGRNCPKCNGWSNYMRVGIAG